MSKLASKNQKHIPFKEVKLDPGSMDYLLSGIFICTKEILRIRDNAGKIDMIYNAGDRNRQKEMIGR